VHVDYEATGSNDGSSWSDAYTNLQAALNEAEGLSSQSEIWVAEGVYKPSESSDPNDSRTVTFELVSNVAIYGGFSGNETSRPDRNPDPSTNNTILSGDVGAEGFQGDDAYHIVHAGGGTDATAVLDGFTIKGGRASAPSAPHNRGGGMYLNGGSPTLRNLLITQNIASDRGGGIFNGNDGAPTLKGVTFYNNSAYISGAFANNRGGDATLTNVTFDSNTGSRGAGAMSTVGSPTFTDVVFINNSGPAAGALNITATANASNRPHLRNVEFRGNTSTGTGVFDAGGALYISDGNPIIEDVVIENNSANRYGGGVFIEGGNAQFVNVILKNNTASNGGGMYWDEYFGGTPALIDVTFENNSSNAGGGLYAANGGMTVQNTRFVGNTSSRSGGGVYCRVNLKLTNVVFSGNEAGGGDGGAILITNDSSPKITNSTFSRNSASDEGGALSISGSNTFPFIRNSVLWGNDAGTSSAEIHIRSGQPLIEHSIVQGGLPDEAADNGGNLTQNPLFADASGPDNATGTIDDDLRLKGPPNDSPGIDAGNNDFLPTDVQDIDGDGNTSEKVPFDIAGNERLMDVYSGSGATVDMGAHESDGSALPVELVHFNAMSRGNQAVLSWETASETNNAGFEVQRMSPKKRFTKVEFVEGYGTTTQSRSYTFIDRDLPYGVDKAAYRLKQIDFDGSFGYTSEVEVSLSRPSELTLETYPNPTHGGLHVRYELPLSSEVRLTIYNTLGQRVSTLVNAQQEAGNKKVVVDTSGLTSGQYLIKLLVDGKVEINKVTVVR